VESQGAYFLDGVIYFCSCCAFWNHIATYCLGNMTNN
jgi:hypothetical protein